MPLKKGFLKNKIAFFNFSKLDLFIGVFVFLSLSFVFYFLMKLLREFFRIFAGVWGYKDLLVLSQNENNFYNFFFAFIAVLFAQSIVITFWLNRPNYFKNKYNYKRNMIVNDHRVTMWYFMHWFAKMGLMFGLVVLDSYSLDFYSDYRYLFYLTAIVLFLQVWNSFRFIFKDRSIKWIIFSFFTVTLVSFGFSKINIIDFKNINEQILQQNEYYKYNIHIPKSSIYHKSNHLNLLLDIYVAQNNSENSEPIIIGNEKNIELSNLPFMVDDINSRVMELEIPFINYRLHIDNDIKMKDIVNLINEFIKVGVKKISYAIKPSDINPNIPFYHQNLLSFNRHNIINNSNESEYSNKIRIDIKYSNNQLYLNNTKIGFLRFKEKSKQLIKNNPNYILVIHIDKNVTFNNYFKILLTFTEGIYELRNEYSLKKYSIEYKLLEKNVRFDRELSSKLRETKEIYPIYIMDKVNNN